MISSSVAVQNLYRDAGVYYVAPIIAQLVQDNSHSRVALIIARIYGSAEDVRQMCEIYNANLRQGYSLSSDIAHRDEVVRRIVREIPDAEERELIYNAM